MNSTVTAGPPIRSRLALIVAGFLALFGSALLTAPAQAGYYDSPIPAPTVAATRLTAITRRIARSTATDVIPAGRA